jgi:hypothetical protein
MKINQDDRLNRSLAVSSILIKAPKEGLELFENRVASRQTFDHLPRSAKGAMPIRGRGRNNSGCPDWQK